MNHPFLDNLISDMHYHHRIMGALIISLLAAITCVKLWPAAVKEPAEIDSFAREAIQVEEVIVTRQTDAPAAPPKPRIPVPVPNDEIIEEVIEFPDLEDMLNAEELAENIFAGDRGEEEKFSGNPDNPPRLSRIVEPVISDKAKAANIKAMIEVTFLISDKGEVREAYISEIRQYDSAGDEYQIVESIGYGLEEATLEAAYKWKFRPATENENQVAAYTTNVFTFGF